MNRKRFQKILLLRPTAYTFVDFNLVTVSSVKVAPQVQGSVPSNVALLLFAMGMCVCDEIMAQQQQGHYCDSYLATIKKQ